MNATDGEAAHRLAHIIRYTHSFSAAVAEAVAGAYPAAARGEISKVEITTADGHTIAMQPDNIKHAEGRTWAGKLAVTIKRKGARRPGAKKTTGYNLPKGLSSVLVEITDSAGVEKC